MRVTSSWLGPVGGSLRYTSSGRPSVDGTAIFQETLCWAASRVVGEPRWSRSPVDPEGKGEGVGGLGTRWMVVCRLTQRAMASREGGYAARAIATIRRAVAATASGRRQRGDSPSGSLHPFPPNQ